ncbi:pyridoxal phosphate-dependent aminotransferase [Patulibacter defluvii]|uniref:pyridoxal phosphate-dependent aminotransferase n=1 Tax=Patulibacter defluvii TaxID=3095358 RepID=UPI002A75DC9B|nr:aminotransferase class I/II-fold pyridoxal phosphate-dependent enzyme [Patulibacter sp. DM4]
MGLFGHYKQFEALTEEEVNAGLREVARERRSKALARVEPLDLSRTTWPELPPSEIVSAITFAARRGLHRYAEGRDGELRDALAERHGIEADRIVVGEGASGLLQRAAHELLDPGDEVVLPWPGYPLYPLLARDAQAVPVPVPELDPEQLLAAVTPRTRLLLLGGPNDPTGDLLPETALAELLERLPERVVVLVDEALREFVDGEPVDATVRLTDRFPRLVLVRSFSKAWGLAGLRCGYAIGGAEAARPGGVLPMLAPRLGIGDLSLAGALAAVRTAGPAVEARARRVVRERAVLSGQLRALGLTVRPSQSCALWVRAPGLDAGGLRSQLERGGVIVQSGDAVGDASHVRISVRDEAASTRLLRAVENAVR